MVVSVKGLGWSFQSLDLLEANGRQLWSCRSRMQPGASFARVSDLGFGAITILSCLLTVSVV